MKKVTMMIVCLAAMLAAGTGLRAQEATIVIAPGYTWISNPSTDTLDFATALGGFVPVQGDVIQSQWGNAQYRNGRWQGAISQFYPGYGYKYKSNRSTPMIVTLGEPLPYESVSTAEPSGVGATSAVVGGTVSIGEGNHVFARGVCWGTDGMPDVDGGHTTDAAVAGSQSVTLSGLAPSTTYHVRAYMVTDCGLSYGNELSFTTLSGIPVVTTAEVTDITGNSALCGGTVTDGGGLEITARGVCWSTSPNPTLSDSHTTDGTGTGSFTSSITGLSASTIYYVRAYASNSLVTIYGGEQSFITEAGGGSGGDHAYVDLGLPSGLLWATCNVGADNPEDYGDYFAWGETQPKDIYNWSTYQYCMGSNSTLTKYCNNSSYGYNGFTDNLTTLLPEDDAATANWGSDWRMPTYEEWQELYQNTTHIWTTQNGVNGRLFTATNGNNLFLPAVGYRYGHSLYDDSRGNYWSSSLDTDEVYYAWNFGFGFESGYCIMMPQPREDGRSVRPVRSSAQNITPTGAINGKFTINSNGVQVYFSQGNLQYQASTNTWKFAENQYDYVGSTNSNISSSYSGWIDLFGWGTSGWNNGNTYYHPWDSNNSSGSTYGPPGQYNLTGSYANADWGVYNPISNGGNQANQWRTLTKYEWAYVFNIRTTSSGIRYAKAKVNDVNGVILLSDNWSSDTYSLSNTNSSGASYSSNTISATQWSALEQAGAVFLPAAGYRGGASVNGVGSSGYYWSASYGNSGNARGVSFNDSSLNTDYSNRRYCGQSVRLVAPAEN